MRLLRHRSAVAERHEDVVEHDVIAARPAHPSGIPNIYDRGLRRRDEQHAIFGMTTVAAWLAIFVDVASSGDNARMLASAAEVVGPAQSIAALDQIRALRWTNLSGDDAFDWAEQTLCCSGFEERGDETARRGNHREPSDRPLDAREFLD